MSYYIRCTWYYLIVGNKVIRGKRGKYCPNYVRLADRTPYYMVDSNTFALLHRANLKLNYNAAGLNNTLYISYI